MADAHTTPRRPDRRYRQAVERVTDQAIILRAWPFSETSQTVALFSRNHGIIRGLAKGAHRPKAPFSGGFEPLTSGEIVAILRDGPGLATLTEWDLQQVCWAARQNLDAYRTATYASEAVYHAVTDRDPHPALYDALVRCFESVGDDANRTQTLSEFQWSLLVETGYQPRLPEPHAHTLSTREVFGFSPALGAVVDDPASSPTHNPDSTGAAPAARGPIWRVRAGTIAALRSLDQQHPQGTHGTHSTATWRRVNRLLASYLAWLLDRELPAARSLFGSGETDRRPTQ